MEKAARPAS